MPKNTAMQEELQEKLRLIQPGLFFEGHYKQLHKGTEAGRECSVFMPSSALLSPPCPPLFFQLTKGVHCIFAHIRSISSSQYPQLAACFRSTYIEPDSFIKSLLRSGLPTAVCLVAFRCSHNTVCYFILVVVISLWYPERHIAVFSCLL